MKKRLYVSLIVIALLSITVMAVSAAGIDESWQVGTPNGAVNPIDGAAEYPATGAYTETFNYYIGSDSNPIADPNMPGYIGPDNVCSFAGGRPCTDTTKNLYIHFDLQCDFLAEELVLQYDRYGSEKDNIYVDTVKLGEPSATENGFLQFTYELPSLSAGSHYIYIEYVGGGDNNGHYIDYIKLDATKTCPIPVEIDVKPGSYPSCFNPNDHGVIPVAIFGSATLDVNDIDVATISFEGAAVAVRGKADKALASYEDINGDGYTDLVVKIEDENLAFVPGDAEATLTGLLYDTTPFQGIGDICVVQ